MELADLKRKWRALQKGGAGATPDVSIGVASSFTIDPLTPYLGAFLLSHGYARPAIGLADYNQIVQSCLSPGVAFGGVDPDVIILAWRLEDIAPSHTPAAMREASELILSAVDALQRSFSGTIILCTPPRPALPSTRLVRFSHPEVEVALWHEASSRLIETFSGRDRMYFVDLEELRAALGPDAQDERKQFLYRQPYTEDYYTELAQLLARIIRARKFEAKKCLVLDCDNTLWGGVIGEDGVGGIQLGEDFPGSAFRRFQQQIKSLADSGVFIALNSKNNPEDVWEVFDSHDSMVLKREDISAAQINWRPKSENLKEIAATLNIGVNSLVFVDDNPFEISEVSTHLPDVQCLRVPEELSELPRVLRENAHLFDRLVITEDDLQRVARMQGEMKRQSLSQQLTAEEFLAQLGLKVYIYEPIPSDLARVTQLINKTNQFNTRTNRFSREEIDAFLATPGNRLFCMSVADKFGDYGLVGVAMLSREGDAYEFVNLLMSCRVLGRGVEATLIAHSAAVATQDGASKLRGVYSPTPKNAMVTDLYERHGFARATASPEGETVWEMALPSDLSPPPFVQLLTDHPA
ncbi:MAG: HAD-IIIC family phosphatase [Parvularculaceae bacterium]